MHYRQSIRLPKTVVILIERVSIDICGKSIQLRIRNRVNIIVLILREFLDEYNDVKVEAVDVATLDTPAKWNSVCCEAIWRNYDLMRPHTLLLFFDYIQEKFSI